MLIKNLKISVTDILRICSVLSGGDASLPPVPKKPKKINRFNADWQEERDKFKFKLTPDQKTRVFELLEGSNLDVREMNQGRRYGRWIRLGEVLGSIDKAKYPKTVDAFFRLRNQHRKGKPFGMPKIRTWYSEVETAFKANFNMGLEKLAERPGEFVRKLDWLVRKNQKDQVKINNILLTLTKIGERASNKVLFEVYTHFENRREPVQNRSIFIKGARAKTKLPDLPAIDGKVIDAIQDTIINTIKSKFADLPEMGKCWIDPELKKIPLPTNMRSLSESLVPIIRGQRIPFGTGKKVIRPFIHWYDERGVEDLDLHGFLLGDGRSMSFGYNGQYKSEFGCFSGDVRGRRGPCAEYVDIDAGKAVAAGYRYFVMVVHNFTQRPLSSLKDCVAGVMEREYPESNDAWTPDTVTNCMKLTSAVRMALIGLYDLETREYIHLDLDWDTFSRYVSGGQSNELFTAIKPYIDLPKLSVYDLLDWHVTERGMKVSMENADVHFRYDDFKTSYVETMKWMGI